MIAKSTIVTLWQPLKPSVHNGLVTISNNSTCYMNSFLELIALLVALHLPPSISRYVPLSEAADFDCAAAPERSAGLEVL